MESKQNTKLEQAKEVVRLVMDEDYSIEEALKKVKKQNQPHNYLIYSLDYEVFDNDGKSIPFEEILNVDGYNNFFEDSIIGKIGAEELLSILDTDERKIAYMYFLERKCQREIAEKIKIKQTTVRNKVIEIRNKLKETTKNTRQNILSSKIKTSSENSTSLYHEMEVCQ